MAYNPNSIWGERKKEEQNPSFQPLEKSPAQKPPETLSDIRESAFKKRHIWWFAIGLVILLAAIGLGIYLLTPNAPPNVAITFSTPNQIFAGSPFSLTISYANNSNVALTGASLSVTLPAGVSFVGQPQNQQVMDQNLGNIAAQSSGTQNISLIVTGTPQNIQHISAALVYGTDANTKTQFETDGGTDIQVGAQAVTMNLNAPTNVFSGSDFTITVSYGNTTGGSVPDANIQIQYPPAFTFVTSTIPAGAGTNNMFDLGALAAGASGSFAVTGHIIGPEKALYALTGTVNANFSGTSYPINTQTANLTIASSPLSINISLNNNASGAYISKAADQLSYTLTYNNTSNVTFRGVTITAVLTGAMFDLTTLQGPGSFNSRSNTITWYAANTPALSSVAPGQSGSVGFSVRTKNSFPIRLVSDKNYVLKVNGEIQSPTVPSNTAGNGTMAVTELDTQIQGQIAITSKGYFHEAKSTGIVNTGPYPPKVDQPTDYTVHWDITNYSTDAQNVTVSAYLQSGTTFTGQVKSNTSSTPTYDPTTGLIRWTIPFIPATTGVIGPPVEVIFQIQNTPAVNQVGQPVTLLGPVTLQATDAFTSSTLSATTQPLTTKLPDDTSLPQGSSSGSVTQ